MTPRRFCRVAFAAVPLCALAACTSGSVEPVTVADETWVNDVRVDAIHVERSNENIPTEVMANLSAHLRTVMDQCVTGARPIDLRVRIDHFEDSNAAAAYLIGDSTGMAGSVIIEDPQTGGAQGEYYIDSMQAGAGIIGAIALSDAESDMPLLFAEQLCEEVFSGKVLEAENVETPGASSVQTPEQSSATGTAGSMTESSENEQGTPNQDVYKPPQ